MTPSSPSQSDYPQDLGGGVVQTGPGEGMMTPGVGPMLGLTTQQDVEQGTYTAEHAEELRRASQRQQFVIYVGGVPGDWTARCYDDETSEHIWSSEGAISVTLALDEIKRALVERRWAR